MVGFRKGSFEYEMKSPGGFAERGPTPDVGRRVRAVVCAQPRPPPPPPRFLSLSSLIRAHTSGQATISSTFKSHISSHSHAHISRHRGFQNAGLQPSSRAHRTCTPQSIPQDERDQGQVRHDGATSNGHTIQINTIQQTFIQQ